ncbi:TetR/AcrR family transcriptional regulator [Microlunatus parietis]|uniref:AcrR family transcriptional regulator n=1 Tax=Microlunatus parietis TaxID=682979 RepID=A0A7Y9LAM6_9ACTN|nr:TetR/AcrR family transcriptional regulator [Microlunatus parietis]NYE69943.1 AcrR family transcriptional regulator [Microlunatus parietis]
MGRRRTFDPDVVLDGAMHAFRRYGFERTSVQRLEQATGLSVGSLYHAYGDKAGLRRAALDHYLSGFVTARLDQITGPAATLDDLEAYLLALFSPPLNDGFGCLITNSAIEVAGEPAAERDLVVRALELMRARFTVLLDRELGAASAGPAATRLLLLTQGILVLARVGLLDDAAEAAVRDEFARLRAVRGRTGSSSRKGKTP